MSASQVILRRGPDYPRPESLHYKSMDLSTEWPSSHPKPDLIKSHNDAPKEPCSCDMDYTERLQRSDFEFLTTLGTGTFARVWLVKPTKEASGRVDVSKVYALKVLRKADVIRLKQCEHTRNERHILSCCRRHPFIAHLVDSWCDWNSLYLLMDYAPGGELFSYLRRNSRFPISTTQFYVAEITSAFIFLHRNGVIYRDLKPENVMIDAHGHVRLVDFGFSKEVGDFETYTLCGTPEYIAPEILLSKGHGKAVDWWALGVLTYELSCGFPPFYDANPNKMYEKILKDDIRFPLSLDLTEDYKDFIRRLCTRDLSARLGNLRGGGSDVKSHLFFSSIDWNELEKKTQLGPLAPSLQHPEDTSCFEPYDPPAEGDPEDYSITMYDKYENYFRDF